MLIDEEFAAEYLIFPKKNENKKGHLMRISINNRLLLEFYLTRVVTISSYMHCAIMFTVEFP